MYVRKAHGGLKYDHVKLRQEGEPTLRDGDR